MTETVYVQTPRRPLPAHAKMDTMVMVMYATIIMNVEMEAMNVMTSPSVLTWPALTNASVILDMKATVSHVLMLTNVRSA